MTTKSAGFRSSDYGGPSNGNINGHDQVDPAYWISVAQRMQAKFPGSSPGCQYVVGYIETPETHTYMPFPAPAGYEVMQYVHFGPTGIEEQMFTAFDAAGLKVILQVEPGNANVPKLATMILNKFKNHPCVVGFGVDVEWLRWIGTNKKGSKTSDTEIKTWLNTVRAINPGYKLLIKHWDPAWLGSGKVVGVTYITDSLGLGSFNGAITEYVSWANHFAGSEIGYQIGYEEDMNWWLPMSDPAKSIIDGIVAKVPTADIYCVYWVDFAIMKEFPDIHTQPVLTTIAVSPTSSSIGVNDTLQLTAICKDQNGNIMTCPTLTWSSSNTSVATVNSSGVATGIATGGPVNIVASSGTIGSNVSAITVTQRILTSITVSPVSVSININNTKQLTTICKDQNGNIMTCPTLIWSSSNASIATINSSGVVTGISAGTSNITAYGGGNTSNTSVVTVMPQSSTKTYTIISGTLLRSGGGQIELTGGTITLQEKI